MSLFKNLFTRKMKGKAAAEELAAFAAKAKTFVDDNPDTLVILGDPHTDVIFMSYKGITAPIRILNRDLSPNKIVAHALKHQRADGDIDRFLLAVDGGLYSIAHALYSKRTRTFTGKSLEIVGSIEPPGESKVTLADGSTLSPIQMVDREP